VGRRWFPVWAFAVNRSREAARLAAKVRTLEHDLAVVTADRDALAAHFALAVDQRNRARDLAVEYEGLLRSMRERPA
jgi:hypothetical protein